MIAPEMLTDGSCVVIQFGHNTIWRKDDEGNPTGWVRAAEHLFRDVKFTRDGGEFRVEIPCGETPSVAQAKALSLVRQLLAILPGFGDEDDRLGRGVVLYYGNSFVPMTCSLFRAVDLYNERMQPDCQAALAVMHETDGRRC